MDDVSPVSFYCSQERYLHLRYPPPHGIKPLAFATAASDDDIFKLSSCTVPSFPTNNEVMHNGNALLVGKRLVYFTVIFQFL